MADDMMTWRVSLVSFLAAICLVQGAPDVCQLESEIGSCKASIPRWFHNPQTNQCEEFFYGGCEGNENNFPSEQDCLDACVTDASGSGDIDDLYDSSSNEGSLDLCELDSEVGPCKAAIPRWFHNSLTKQCEQFTYGGCDGNDNNFSEEEECQDACALSSGSGSVDSLEYGGSFESIESSGDLHYELK